MLRVLCTRPSKLRANWTYAISCEIILVMMFSMVSSSYGDAIVGKESRHLVKIGHEVIKVYAYKPKHCPADGKILLVFSGFERNAREYMRRAKLIAQQACLTVYAPDLDRERFPRWRYQRGGLIGAADQKTDNCMGLFLSEFISWARNREGRPSAPYILFGHSAGAQMLSRVSAYCPVAGPSRIVVANPSAYVAASLAEDVPYGFRDFSNSTDRQQRLKDYLAQPITIYLGSEDVGNVRLDNSSGARRQGRNRFERGRFVYQAARLAARRRGWPFNWQLVVADGAGHSSQQMLSDPNLAEALGLEQNDFAGGLRQRLR